jgi:HSP20 family protein
MPAGIRRHPGAAILSTLRRELDDLFQEMVVASEGASREPSWLPAADVLELPEAVLVVLEVPGATPHELEVYTEAPVVGIRGRRQLSVPGGDGTRFHRLERPQGPFARELEISLAVDFAAARAELCGGVLVIELPKLEERRRRQRRIRVVESDEVEEVET